MATKSQIENLLKNVTVNINKMEVVQAMDQKEINRMQKERDIKGFLLSNAKWIDIKKLLLIIVEKLKEIKEEYEEEGNDKKAEEVEIELKKAIRFAKSYIKLDEPVKISKGHHDDNRDRVEILTSNQIIYGEEAKNENARFDRIKEWIPQAEKQEIVKMSDVFQQMLEDEFIAKMTYIDVLINALAKNRNERKRVEEKYIFGKSLKDRDEIIKEMAQEVQEEAFQESFHQTLEEVKGYIEEDKYLLFYMHKINQKLEQEEELKEDEKVFLENIEKMLEGMKEQTRFVFEKNHAYGKMQAKQFLARRNLETGEYSTEEQLRTGEKMLSDTQGYEDYLKKEQIRELAQYEENLIYLFQRRKITRNDMMSILRNTEISQNALLELYNMGALTLKQVEEYAKSKEIDIEEVREKIKQKKEIDLNNLDSQDKETWSLLTKEEKIKALSQMIEKGKGKDKILEDFGREEVEEMCQIEGIAQLYQDIYGKGEEDKREKYEDLIKLYNLVGEADKEEIIFLLESELSDEMLMNLYQDKLISIEILESYGDKELVMEAFYQGRIQEKDICTIIKKYPIELTEEQIVEWYEKGDISAEDIIELYLQDKVKLKTIQLLGEEVEEQVTAEKLIECYRQARKSKDTLPYKKYNLLYQTVKDEKIDIKALARKGFRREDILQLYEDNLVTIEAMLNYGGEELIQELAIKGNLSPKDAKEFFRKGNENDRIKEILRNPDMEDVQKMMLIYSTYDDDKEMRDELVECLHAYATELKGEGGKEQKEIQKREAKEKKQTITDPYERWKLFSRLDKGYTKKYIDGYLIVTLNNSQKTIVEKMYKKEKGKIIPAYGVATFMLDTENYIELEDKLIREDRMDMSVLRKEAKENPERVAKITHHPPSKDKEGKEKNSWGKKILREIGEEKTKEIYTEEDLEEIEACLRDVEKSREAWEK